MERIILRNANIGDAPYILKITKAAFTQYAQAVRNSSQVKALKETLSDVEKDIQTKHVLVCELDGDIVGSVRFHMIGDNIAYLSRFAMSPEVQNLGLGGLLMEKVRLECLNLGVKAIVLHTASRMRSSVAFYLKNGYYIHSIDKSTEYLRALMVNELIEMDELYDYESLVAGN